MWKYEKVFFAISCMKKEWFFFFFLHEWTSHNKKSLQKKREWIHENLLYFPSTAHPKNILYEGSFIFHLVSCTTLVLHARGGKLFDFIFDWKIGGKFWTIFGINLLISNQFIMEKRNFFNQSNHLIRIALSNHQNSHLKIPNLSNCTLGTFPFK